MLALVAGNFLLVPIKSATDRPASLNSDALPA
jgi:hypothetical protein